MNRSIFLLITVIIVGCGSSESMNEARNVVDNFRCVKADFARIEHLISSAKMDIGNFSSSEEGVYQLAEKLNKKMAEECSATALIRCSKGKERAVKADDIWGPVNALGVSGKADLVERPETDGLAHTRGWKLVYKLSVNKEKYLSGLACFQSETK